jgi:glutamine synthetase
MGELEYYVISEKQSLFAATDQRGYHESTPFVKWEQFRNEAMIAIAQAGGVLKYSHSEVGNFHIENLDYEQNEIEFMPVDVEDAADQLVNRQMDHAHPCPEVWCYHYLCSKDHGG